MVDCCVHEWCCNVVAQKLYLNNNKKKKVEVCKVCISIDVQANHVYNIYMIIRFTLGLVGSLSLSLHLSILLCSSAVVLFLLFPRIWGLLLLGKRLNNMQGTKRCPVLPVSIENYSDNSPLNFTLHIECCTHVFTSRTSFAWITSWVIFSQAFTDLWSHTLVYNW